MKKYFIGGIIVLFVVIVFLIVSLIEISGDEQSAKVEALHKTEVITKKDEKFEQLQLEYNKLNDEYLKIKTKYNKLVEENISSQFVERYMGKKYPVASGIKKYIGEEPLRSYPSSLASYVFNSYKPDIVEVINEVSCEDENWCLVIDNNGISGYANGDDLVAIEKDDDSTNTGISETETLGGFKIGQRIETLIGLLDRDYYLIYENGRIYQFLDSKEVSGVEPMDRPFEESLDAFVGNTNHIWRLRTDSPKFALKDGYKAGDNAMKVIKFYESKYKYSKDADGYWYSKYTFDTGDVHLEFLIDTEELNENSIIKYIIIG